MKKINFQSHIQAQSRRIHRDHNWSTTLRILVPITHQFFKVHIFIVLSTLLSLKKASIKLIVNKKWYLVSIYLFTLFIKKKFPPPIPKQLVKTQLERRDPKRSPKPRNCKPTKPQGSSWSKAASNYLYSSNQGFCIIGKMYVVPRKW